MKININQGELQNALSVVAKGLSTRSTLPILSGIHMQAYDDTLVVQTTDLELSIKYSVATLIETEGETVVPGKLFLEIIKSLPDAAVSLELQDSNLIIICDAASFSIKTLSPEDFPGFPVVEAEQSISLSFSQFSSMVKKVARVVSKDESRAILNGVLIVVEDKHIKMVATDSYRLAITEADIEELESTSFEAVILGSFLLDIAAMAKSDETISLALSENQIVVTYQNTVFVNRRIEGSFPNYKQLLPDKYNSKADLSNENLIAAVKRISLLNDNVSPIRFDLNIDSQTIQLSSVAQDVGSAQETLLCSVEGEDVEIAFNHNYVLDGLMAMPTDNVLLEVQNSMKPGIFRAGEGEDFLYLIMPVRLS